MYKRAGPCRGALLTGGLLARQPEEPLSRKFSHIAFASRGTADDVRLGNLDDVQSPRFGNRQSWSLWHDCHRLNGEEIAVVDIDGHFDPMDVGASEGTDADKVRQGMQRVIEPWPIHLE